jgi:hypothetical protein
MCRSHVITSVLVLTGLLMLRTASGQSDEGRRPRPPTGKQPSAETGSPRPRGTGPSRVETAPQPAPKLEQSVSPETLQPRSGSTLDNQRGSVRTQQLLDTLNNRPTTREHATWGVFLGTTWSESKLKLIEQWQREGKWRNPLTGEPLKDAKVFVFGHDNALKEGLRIVGDHLEIHALSSWEKLHGQQFDNVLCHSNGCTDAINAHRQGQIQVETFFALGTDWTSKHFQPGDLRGSQIVFFVMRGDPIWKIPAPDWTRVGEDGQGVGLKFSIPFNSPREIPSGIKNLFTQGRADPDRFPVIRLEPPAGQQSTPVKPFRAHGLVESYFPALEQWRQADGPQQREVRELLRRVDSSLGPEDRKKSMALPPGCPECGGGSGGGTTGLGTLLQQGPGNGTMPKRIGQDPRGGIAVDVHITPRDFQTP